MLMLRADVQVFIYQTAIDMRKSINGLSLLVQDELAQSPGSGHVYVFYNRAKDKVKCLYWDKNGFILHYKRLERRRFRFLNHPTSPTIEVTQDQLSWLLAGLDFLLMDEFSELNYAHYG